MLITSIIKKIVFYGLESGYNILGGLALSGISALDYGVYKFCKWVKKKRNKKES